MAACPPSLQRSSGAFRGPVPDQEPTTCIIPGDYRDGREVLADSLAVADHPLEFEFHGRCGYDATFAYSSEDE